MTTSVKVHALLSFFDEPNELLVACIAGLANVGVDHVVACDGRYAMYPADHDISDPNQHGTIHMACRKFGMACTLSVPNGPWEGNEVEKRTALFDLGWSLADEGDWFWVQDADQITLSAPKDWKRRLAETDLDAAYVNMHDPLMAANPSDDWPADFQMRSLFRAQPIRCHTNHCTYVTEDGRVLWGAITHSGKCYGQTQVEGLDMTCIKVEHRTHERPPERRDAKMRYYADRDHSGVERGFCECGEKSVKLVARNWRKPTDLKGKVVADWHEACERHARKWEYESYWELKRLGADPDTVHNRNGKVPTA